MPCMLTTEMPPFTTALVPKLLPSCLLKGQVGLFWFLCPFVWWSVLCLPAVEGTGPGELLAKGMPLGRCLCCPSFFERSFLIERKEVGTPMRWVYL